MRRPLYFLGVGVAAAALLAVVLFAGIGRGSAGPGTGGPPRINAATSDLLSLSTIQGASLLAKPFRLTDQHGRTVGPAAFRGKAVVVSFNDDECPDLCTLLANDIIVANRDLGPLAKKVVWLSVNVNPFHPQVAAVRAWTDEHGLGSQPNWYFTTASPPVLARVWKEYGVYVGVDRATRTVVHGTELFFVDPSGHERAVAEFGAAAANTSLYAHGIAQLAADLLGSSRHVGGPVLTGFPGKAPAFTLPYLSHGSGRFSLSAEHGRVTVVNFYSSTCTACRAELPHLEAVHRWAGPAVDFVGVDVADGLAAGRAMASRAGVTYPLVSDRNGAAAGAEKVPGLPFTLILDTHGVPLVRHPGVFTTEQLKYLLENFVPSLGRGG